MQLARKSSARALLALLAFGVAGSGCMASRMIGRNFAVMGKAAEPAPGASEAKLLTGAADDAIRIVRIGHASVLVQLGDKTILTDPVFTRAVGQLQVRRVQPGLVPDQLPKIDAVLISHMHFDHLSLGSLDQIEGKTTRLFVPPGGLNYLPNYAFDARELDRWEAFEDDGLRITAVPVKHVGFRYGLDAAWSRESFTGYVIEYRGMSVYFAGDTAYDGDNFRATRNRFPQLGVALMPIAPVEPRAFMQRTHVGPAEALQAFLDLDARSMVPIHYDAFANSTDRPGDALRALAQSLKSRPIEPSRVVVLEVGARQAFQADGQLDVPASAEPAPSDAASSEPAPAEAGADADDD